MSVTPSWNPWQQWRIKQFDLSHSDRLKKNRSSTLICIFVWGGKLRILSCMCVLKSNLLKYITHLFKVYSSMIFDKYIYSHVTTATIKIKVIFLTPSPNCLVPLSPVTPLPPSPAPATLFHGIILVNHHAAAYTGSSVLLLLSSIQFYGHIYWLVEGIWAVFDFWLLWIKLL